MPDFVSEDQCLLCSGIVASERVAFRATLETIPLDDSVCDACTVAFFRNIGFPVSDKDETEH